MENFIQKTRRHLHKNPELGYETYETAKFIYNTLVDLGYKPRYAMNNAAVIAKLDLNKAKTIGLRSDMDALEVKEETGLDFASSNGKMHACGHDGHMTILLATAKLIMENKDKLKYNVVLFFQPAEEGPLPGGAYYLKNEPEFQEVDEFYAYHVTAKLNVGEIGIKYEEATAAPDLWELEIIGKGSHGSTPELGHSPILAGTKVVSRFEELYQELRKNNMLVISTTYFKSGVSMNIILDKAYLKGTARSFTDEMRDTLKNRMQEILNNIEKEDSVKCNFDFHYAYPPLYNEPTLADKMILAGNKILGEGNAIKLDKPELIGEDFAYYKEIAPTCLTWLGIREPNEPFYDLHNSKFKVSEKALLLAAKIYLELLTN